LTAKIEFIGSKSTRNPRSVTKCQKCKIWNFSGNLEEANERKIVNKKNKENYI